MNHLSTLKRRLRLITRLASEESLSFETQDAIALEAQHALNDVDELDQPSVDNVLHFKMRESTAEASTMLACIVDAK